MDEHEETAEQILDECYEKVKEAEVLFSKRVTEGQLHIVLPSDFYTILIRHMSRRKIPTYSIGLTEAKHEALYGAHLHVSHIVKDILVF